jgi:hypothetical protein
MSLLPHVHVTAVILQRSKLTLTLHTSSGAVGVAGSVTVPLRWKPEANRKGTSITLETEERRLSHFSAFLHVRLAYFAMRFHLLTTGFDSSVFAIFTLLCSYLVPMSLEHCPVFLCRR